MEKSIRSKIKWDVILISILLLVAVAAFLIVNFTGNDGMNITVTVEGKTVGSYPLSEDLEKEIVTPYGKNVIVIKDGHAQITFADCPDGICSSHRPIKKNGENIICLPHKLVVVISGEGDK